MGALVAAKVLAFKVSMNHISFLFRWVLWVSMDAVVSRALGFLGTVHFTYSSQNAIL